MPRINPRLDPHELADLMAAPEHWDLLDQVPRHPAAWPDLATWAKLAVNDPSTAGAPPEPPTGTPRKRRLRAIQPILWDEKKPEADESNKSGNSTASDSSAIAESETPDQNAASSSASNMSEAEEIFTGDSTADETEEPPIRVRRRVPWARNPSPDRLHHPDWRPGIGDHHRRATPCPCAGPRIMQSSNPTSKQAIRPMERSPGRRQATAGIGRHRRDRSRGTGLPTQRGRTSRDERNSSLLNGSFHGASRRERPHCGRAQQANEDSPRRTLEGNRHRQAIATST